MGGGLMQLVAYGAQDIYLTGNPQITFLKLSIEDTLTFLESINKLFGSVLWNSGTSASFTISRNGDLVHKMYLQMNHGAITNLLQIHCSCNIKKELELK